MRLMRSANLLEADAICARTGREVSAVCVAHAADDAMEDIARGKAGGRWREGHRRQYSAAVLGGGRGGGGGVHGKQRHLATLLIVTTSSSTTTTNGG